MPGPLVSPFQNANNQTWLHDMQSYFAPNKKSGRPGRDKMPDRNSAIYSMKDVDDETIRRLLIALFGGDSDAADMYLAGDDPSGQIRYGGSKRNTLQDGIKQVNAGRAKTTEGKYKELVGY